MDDLEILPQVGLVASFGYGLSDGVLRQDCKDAIFPIPRPTIIIILIALLSMIILHTLDRKLAGSALLDSLKAAIASFRSLSLTADYNYF